MSQPASARQLLRFGVFELDASAGELCRQGRKVTLQQQPLQVLTLLLRRPGEVVTREELQQELWPGDTFVEFDQGLNTAIKKIRKALGDSAENPRFVETIPRKGYRFIAAVSAAPPASHHGTQIVSRTRLWVAAVAALVLAVVVGAAGWVLKQPTETAAIVPRPLTSYLGIESRPSFSPDGAQVVFDWQRAGGNFEIRRKTIGEDESVHLADGCCAVWSPDGRSIAFLGGQQPSWTLDRAAPRRILWMSSLGGAARDLGEMHAEKDPGIAWHPGGEWLVVSDKPSPKEPGALFAVSLADGTRRRLTSPPPDSYDTHPAVSPDGEALVFARSRLGPSSVLHLVELSQDLRPMNDPKPLTSIEVFGIHPAWSMNSRAIVFVAGNLHAWALHELQFSRPGWKPGIPRRLPFGGEGVVTPAISTSGQLAYANLRCGADIWRLALDGAGRASAAPKRWISSTRVDHGPQYSPDGNKVAFASNRTGSHEIYVSNSDGSSARALTSFGGDAYTADPRWSPDGQMLVFHSNPEGTKDVFVVSLIGGGRGVFSRTAHFRLGRVTASGCISSRMASCGSVRGHP